MVTKILQYGVVVGLLAALVGGTAYILTRPAEAYAVRGGEHTAVAQAGGDAGSDRGNGYRAAERVTSSNQGRGRQAVMNNDSNVPGSGQGGGNGIGGPGTGSGPNAAESEMHDWLTVQGVVLVADNELTIQTANEELLIGMGQAWYREQAGFTVAVGDEVIVYGFHEDGEFKAGTVENRTTGDTLTLRDVTGRPMWAGNGNQRNRP